MAIMSKIETTGKVSLKLTRVNLGRRGARVRRALDFGHSSQAPLPPPTVWKKLSPGLERPINTPFRTAKAVSNGNHRLIMSKIETTNKVPMKFSIRINLGRRGAHALSSRLWTRPTSPPSSTARKGPIPVESIASSVSHAKP